MKQVVSFNRFYSIFSTIYTVSCSAGDMVCIQQKFFTEMAPASLPKIKLKFKTILLSRTKLRHDQGKMWCFPNHNRVDQVISVAKHNSIVIWSFIISFSHGPVTSAWCSLHSYGNVTQMILVIMIIRIAEMESCSIPMQAAPAGASNWDFPLI